MSKQYWLEKWQTGDTHFHQKLPNPVLVNVFADVPTGKVLVPLCGKSFDMFWLREQAHFVIGVELSEMACRAFFEENNIPYQQSNDDGFIVFSGDHVEIWCGDFFALPKKAYQGVTVIYDRAALVALDTNLRQRYAEKIIEIAESQAGAVEMLLLNAEYTAQRDGPPFCVDANEVRRLYGKTFEIKELVQYRDDDIFRTHPKLNAIKGTQRTLLLTRRS